MANPTIQARLGAMLHRRGCAMVRTVSGGWQQWTLGQLLPGKAENSFFFLGPAGGFRFGKSKTVSRDYPKTKARLLADYDAGLDIQV